MKVITIKQPWASLIAYGYKEYEFRSWKTNYRGEIYIHSSKTIDKKAMIKFSNLDIDFACGKIIAKANIIDCVLITDEIKKNLCKKNKDIYSTCDIYGFKLENIELYDGIYINGKLSIWNLKKDD